MLYFLAIILPPLAVFLCCKPIQGILNIILTICGWLPGVVHALFVVNTHLADKRNKALIEAIEKRERY